MVNIAKISPYIFYKEAIKVNLLLQAFRKLVRLPHCTKLLFTVIVNNLFRWNYILLKKS